MSNYRLTCLIMSVVCVAYSIQADNDLPLSEESIALICVADRTSIRIESYTLQELFDRNKKVFMQEEADTHVFLHIGIEANDSIVKMDWSESSPGTIIITAAQNDSLTKYEFRVFDVFDFRQDDIDEIVGICLKGIIQENQPKEETDQIYAVMVDIPLRRGVHRLTFNHTTPIVGCCCILLPKHLLDIPLHARGSLNRQDALDCSIIKRSENSSQERDSNNFKPYTFENSWWLYLKDKTQQAFSFCSDVATSCWKTIVYYVCLSRQNQINN